MISGLTPVAAVNRAWNEPAPGMMPSSTGSVVSGFGPTNAAPARSSRTAVVSFW